MFQNLSCTEDLCLLRMDVPIFTFIPVQFFYTNLHDWHTTQLRNINLFDVRQNSSKKCYNSNSDRYLLLLGNISKFEFFQHNFVMYPRSPNFRWFDLCENGLGEFSKLLRDKIRNMFGVGYNESTIICVDRFYFRGTNYRCIRLVRAYLILLFASYKFQVASKLDSLFTPSRRYNLSLVRFFTFT